METTVPNATGTSEQGVDFKAAAADIVTANRAAIAHAMTGLPTDDYVHLLRELAWFDPATVKSFCDLLAAVRAASWTAPLDVYAEQVDTGWQILDAKDEETWHPVTGVAECEDPNCAVRAEGYDCTVLVSSAWTEGYAHCDSDGLVKVRIPAGEPA